MNQLSKYFSSGRNFGALVFSALLIFAVTNVCPICAQEAGVSDAINKLRGEGGGVFVIGPAVTPPPVPVFFKATLDSTVNIGTEKATQTVSLAMDVVQGEAKEVQLAVFGEGEILSVVGEGVESYAVVKSGEQRYLELRVKPELKTIRATIEIASRRYELPSSLQLTHLGPAQAVGFDSVTTISVEKGIVADYSTMEGFVRLLSPAGSAKFQTRSGGVLTINLEQSATTPDPIEIIQAKLVGTLTDDQQSVDWQWSGNLFVHQAGAAVDLLSGNVAIETLPSDSRIQVRLISDEGKYRYRATFLEAGEVDLSLSMIAPVHSLSEDRHGLEFKVASGAVVPVELIGLAESVGFSRGEGLMLPRFSDGRWQGFLPADGSLRLEWQEQRSTAEGKLFFSTTGRVEARVGSGLLRQEHYLTYQILQGELDSLRIAMEGPGEILDVQGADLVSWKVVSDSDEKHLEVVLSKPFKETSEFLVRSQTALGSFPLEVEGMSLVPEQAIRHSGFLRVSNVGSVRIEPTATTGLSQLAPEQFPGEALQSRQVYVYRFPSAKHGFSVVADRIQPEVNVSEVIRYELRETEKLLLADIELDIREAPIRDWSIRIPADYSVVSVTGANVTDYLATSEIQADRRELKVIFGQDIVGRQLVGLHLEKSEIAAEENWNLPRIDHPDAKSIRGDVGIVGAPGYRLGLDSIDLLIEKPLSYFPKPTPNLQHAFRMRSADWTAVTQIERLDRSIQSDVFHLYSLSEESIYGSALINYFITGAPVSELKIRIPEQLKNEVVDGQDVQDARRAGDLLTVTLHQPVMGSYTLLVTFEEKSDTQNGLFKPGSIQPLEVQGERGYIHVVSPMQVEMEIKHVSPDVLSLDPLELPNEFRLLSTAPTLGAWQYTERPFQVDLGVRWFRPGSTIDQVVEFAEVDTTISQDGEQVTSVLYFVKSRGQRSLRIKLPDSPVRLWEVSVDGQPVTARDADGFTLIPLPTSTDPNIPVEVSLRLGKPVVWETKPTVALPQVFSPILKTQWNLIGDDQRLISPAGGTVSLPRRVLPPTGFEWIAQRGFLKLLVCIVVTGLALQFKRRKGMLRHGAFVFAVIAIALAMDAASEAGKVGSYDTGIHLSLPIISSGEVVRMDVYNTPLWRANLSSTGLVLPLIGLAGLIASLFEKLNGYVGRLRSCSVFFVSIGVLLHHDSASTFFWLVALMVVVLVGFRSSIDFVLSAKSGCARWLRSGARRSDKETESREMTADQDLSEDDSNDISKESNDEGDGMGGTSRGGTIATILAFFVFSFSGLNAAAQQSAAAGAGQSLFATADHIEQVWSVEKNPAPLKSNVSMRVSGKVGDQFVLLRAPAVLTQFDGTGIKLSKFNDPKKGMVYLVTLLPNQQDERESRDKGSNGEFVSQELTFAYQIESFDAAAGIPLLTGDAAVNRLEVNFDDADLEVTCSTAVQTSVDSGVKGTKRFVLAPGSSTVKLSAKRRDLTMEETNFFVETTSLYIPRPGVVDGIHRIDLRTSQGVLESLTMLIPDGLTVSQVEGPVASWQFDADKSVLELSISPAQSTPFSVIVETQKSLDALPADVELAPIRVQQADGEVGILGLAFDGDSKPEKIETQSLSPVNVGDFDVSLLGGRPATLHRVYRYGAQGGSLNLSVAAVTPEVRVVTKQVLSLGDERVILAISLSAEITRTGLFKLTFPLPEGFEVESLSGSCLSHWTELTENEQRKVVMHLDGKTIGGQTFALSLTANTPGTDENWTLPRFEVEEAIRQAGELIVQPATGIRLSTESRQNVSEVDPRVLGSTATGAVAYRLLQSDWSLVLGIEKLDPRISGDVLIETDLKEGQTRSTLIGDFDVQNASIRSLKLRLPISDAEEIKTLRSSGSMVSDLILLDEEQQIWELQFKRRVLGRTNFRIEYERRGDRAGNQETLRLVSFPDAGQVNTYFAIRAGGRLEIVVPENSVGWNKIDWSSVPSGLRAFSVKQAPTVAMRIQKSAKPLTIDVARHSIADALKLRVASGNLTSVLSPNGDQLTLGELNMEVIQRSSLLVGLPAGGEIFSVFVNGESVNTIRIQSGNKKESWQFYVLPGVDGRTAEVKYVYSVPGNGISSLRLVSPQLNVPLENINWQVVAPEGYELRDHNGNVDLVQQTRLSTYDRNSYLRKSTLSRQQKAEQAASTLQQANQFIQKGEQSKANMLLNSVANQYGLDAASNEDARIQLENLQTQQAIVGLNTRRQRFLLDNDPEEVAIAGGDQLRQAAENNPILQQGTMNFQLQEMSQLLRGNSSEDNAVLQRIAGRLVQHQRTTEPAPQAIVISLPEEGEVSTFSRSVQVSENSPLELQLEYVATLDLPFGRSLFTLLLLFVGSAALVGVIGVKKV